MRALAIAVLCASCSSQPAAVGMPEPQPQPPPEASPIVRPRIVAHRGASFDAPENTLAAFRRAWELGVEAVELDVHLTRDGEAVVIHDADTKRVARVDRLVADQTLAELSKLDVAGERIPTLAQAISTVPRGRTLFVEIKTKPETAAAIARAIRTADPASRGATIALQGFDPAALSALAAELPDAAAYWTVMPPLDDQDRPLPYPRDIIATAVKHRFPGVALLVTSVTRELLADAKAAGLLVDLWTINDAPSLAILQARDDVRWIETDRPDLAVTK